MASIVRVSIDVAGVGEAFQSILGGDDVDYENAEFLTGRMCFQYVVKVNDEPAFLKEARECISEVASDGFTGVIKLERGEMTSPTEFLPHKVILVVKI